MAAGRPSAWRRVPVDSRCDRGGVLEIRYCALCQVDTVFEQPPCLDDHGADCPEWTCTVCGLAVFVGSVPAPAPQRRAVAA